MRGEPGMQVLVDAREKLDIQWEHPTSELAANQVKLFHGMGLDQEQFAQYASTIHVLWQDRAIKKAYDRRREFQIVSLQQKVFCILCVQWGVDRLNLFFFVLYSE